MAYSKQAADENKTMLNRALQVVDEVGWNFDEERGRIETGCTGGKYYSQKLQDAYKIMLVEFPGIDARRVKSRTVRAFSIMRSRSIHITPHKGGRSDRFYGRCTPDVSRMAEAVKSRTGLSAADIYEQKVRELHRELFGNEN